MTQVGRLHAWFSREIWHVCLVAILIFLLAILPVRLVNADEHVPESGREATQQVNFLGEESRTISRGILFMGGAMVLVVVLGAANILRLDQANRPHLLQKGAKQGLPDATVRKNTPEPPQPDGNSSP